MPDDALDLGHVRLTRRPNDNVVHGELDLTEEDMRNAVVDFAVVDLQA